MRALAALLVLVVLARADHLDYDEVASEGLDTNSVVPDRLDTNSVVSELLDTNSVEPDLLDTNSMVPDGLDTNSVKPDGLDTNSVVPDLLDTNSVEPDLLDTNSVKPDGLDTNFVVPNRPETNSVVPDLLDINSSEEEEDLHDLPEHDPSGWPQSLLEFYNGTDEHFSTLDFTSGKNNNGMQSRFNLIFPGTRWCGPGNIASSESDLGVFAAADSCCRTHDHCPDFIDSLGTKHGLTNSGPTIKLLCDCDSAFYECLRSINSLVSNKLGRIFFNLVGNDCFKEEFPATGCNTYSFFRTRCLAYNLDTSQPKKFQWFNNPLY